MKVLSLLQPWAGLLVNGSKGIETRSFQVKYRGPLLIHASKGRIYFDQLDGAFLHTFSGCDKRATKETCCIIGAVCLDDIQTTDYLLDGPSSIMFTREHALGDYSPNRYGWVCNNPVVFEKPIPASGALGIWNHDGIRELSQQAADYWDKWTKKYICL